MRFQSILGVFFLLVLTASTMRCSGNQAIKGHMADVDVTNWDILAIIEVRYPQARYDISTQHPDTKYHKFRIVSHDWAMNIAELEVFLDGDERWRPEIKGLYMKNSASDIVEIPAKPRTIDRVKVRFQNMSSLGTPIVYFWGKREG